MAGTDWAAIGTGVALVIAALGVSVPQIGTFIIAWRARDDVKTMKETVAVVKDMVVAVNDKADVLHTQGNSNADRLEKLSKAAGYAEGRDAGIAEERATPMVQATP